MILKPIVAIGNPGTAYPVNLRCPACRREVTFETLGFPDTKVSLPEAVHYSVGQRMCGNPECRAHLFVVLDAVDGAAVATYPAETIDFDASDIPTRVVEAFEEAIKSHAQHCYIAAAIMVRKTLEEVCEDRGATGKNLKDKIETLGSNVVLPQALLKGLDDLRLLGNDAAHLESRVYEQVGKVELEVAIDVTKEILRATYQYEGLMGRLRALQKGEEES